MPRLTLYLLGDFRVELDGSPVSDFSTEKTRALLAYICVEASRAHRREHLASLFWPEQAEEDARRSFRQALFQLRQILQRGSESTTRPEPEFAQHRSEPDAKEDPPDLLRLNHTPGMIRSRRRKRKPITRHL